MATIDHWHPVLLSRKLKRKPVPVRLCGKDLVVFRTAAGEIGALADSCVHRRMRLSLGTVEGCRLRCQYHGWTYDAAGAGESPATPKMHAQAEAFDTREAFGLVWVKPRDADAKFPNLDVAGFYHLCTLGHHAPAPLETTVDNFCEIEHTPTVHAFFGYALDGMHEVQVRFETTDTSVRVINHGPPKPIAWLWRRLLKVGEGYQFNDDWTTYFSPVY